METDIVSEIAIVGQPQGSGLATTPAAQAVQKFSSKVNFGSKFAKVKPGTVNIVQPNSQAEGAIKGNLRIHETGDQFKEMRVALLLEPVEQRAYYIGQGDGQMNRTPENLMCFSRDMKQPDAKAKVPQSFTCAGCPNASWDKYRQTKSKNDIPPCDAYYHVVMIDGNFKLPLQMYVRSKSKKPFDTIMENVTRTLLKYRSQTGIEPDYFDCTFTLFTKAEKNNNGTTTYVLAGKDFSIITPEEREEFGEVFANFVAARTSAGPEGVDVETKQIAANVQSVDDIATGDTKVLEPEYVAETEEIAI